jgi:natural product precursor
MKLDRIKLNGNVDLLNDQEMKMMKGGYGYGYGIGYNQICYFYDASENPIGMAYCPSGETDCTITIRAKFPNITIFRCYAV